MPGGVAVDAPPGSDSERLDVNAFPRVGVCPAVVDYMLFVYSPDAGIVPAAVALRDMRDGG